MDSRSTFDDFVREEPRNTVDVCGKTYTCRSSTNSTGGERLYWSAGETDANVDTSRKCNVDILAAAAYSNSHCNTERLPAKNMPFRCAVQDPFMTNGTSIAQLRGGSTSLPTILEASWTCMDDGVVTDETHEPMHMEKYGGGITMLHVKERTTPVAPPVATQAAPPVATQAAPPVVPPVATQATPPVVPPVVQEAQQTTSSTKWHRCQIRSEQHQLACAVDEQCPLGDAKYRELLWSKSRELGIEMTQGLQEFMMSMKTRISDDLEWIPTNIEALEDMSQTEAGVKSALMTLLENDDVFNESVRNVVDDDPDFATALVAARKGVCSSGRCATTRVYPTTRLYNSEEDMVTLSLSDDKRVMYTRDGVTHEAHAQRCSEAIQSQCDLAEPVGEFGQPPSLHGKAVSSAYRVLFPGVEEEYLVMNHVEVGNKKDCAARVCEHNTTACPASVCKRTEEGACVAP